MRWKTQMWIKFLVCRIESPPEYTRKISWDVDNQPFNLIDVQWLVTTSNFILINQHVFRRSYLQTVAAWFTVFHFVQSPYIKIKQNLHTMKITYYVVIYMPYKLWNVS